MKMNKFYIIGAGGLGKEAYFIINRFCNLYKKDLYLDSYIDESLDKIGKLLYGVEIKPLSGIEDGSRYVVAMGDVQPRIKFSTYVEKTFGNVKPFSLISDNLNGINYKIGDGSIVFPDVTLTADVNVGKFCVIYQNCSINHDSSVGNFTTLCPNVNIAACSSVGDCCYIGVGSTISNKVSICDNVVLGANTCVVKNICESGLYVGTPARKIKEVTKWQYVM